MFPNLVKYLTSGAEEDVRILCLELISILISKFNVSLLPYFGNLERLVVDILKSNKSILRKKAIQVLGTLAIYQTSMVRQVVEMAVEDIKGKSYTDITKSHLHCLTTVLNSNPSAFAIFVDAVVPLVDSTLWTSDDDEILENCLYVLEAAARNCTFETSKYQEGLYQKAFSYISYDPNYVEDMSIDEDDYPDDEDEYDDYSDDEDQSWKVRKASLRLLNTFSQLYEIKKPNDLVVSLVSRFKERNISVKYEVFTTFESFLSHHAQFSKTVNIPSLLKAIKIQLNDKAVKSKHIIFSLLKRINIDFNNPENFDLIFPVFTPMLASNNNVSEVISYIASVVSQERVIKDESLWDIVSKLIVTKKTTEALNLYIDVLGQIIQAQIYDLNCLTHIDDIYQTCVNTLQSAENNFEFKESSINFLALYFIVKSRINSNAVDAFKYCTDVMIQKLVSTEALRTKILYALKSIIASTSAFILPNDSLSQLVTEMCSYMRKTDRGLKLAGLACFQTVLQAYETTIDDNCVLTQILPSIMQSLNVDHADLQIAYNTLSILKQIMSRIKVSQPVSALISGEIMPKLCNMFLNKDSILQGDALSEFVACIRIYATTLSMDAVKALIKSIYSTAASFPGGNKKSYLACARVIATIIEEVKDKNSLTSELISILRSSSSTASDQVLSLYCISEIGKNTEIIPFKDISGLIVSQYFEKVNDDLSNAASRALGLVACGNLDANIPILFGLISQNPNHKLAYFNCLKEMLSASGEDDGNKLQQFFARFMYEPRRNLI
jgi:cullin-associated NEDD8-dissociated protein 1